MMHRHYRFGDVDAALGAQGLTVDAALAQVMGYLGAAQVDDPPTGAHVRLDLIVGAEAPAVPDGARRVTIEEAHGGLWDDGRYVYLASDVDGLRSVVRIDATAGTATAELHPDLLAEPGELWRRLYVLVTWSLFLLLHPHRLYPLHAAALGRDGRGLLLVANSDCGKSTLAYSLVREGWRYLSDDMVLLRAGGPAVDAVPFRRRFGLDAVAGRFFPELARGGHGPQLVEEDKWSVDVERFAPGQAVDVLRPDVLVLPQIVDADESRVELAGPVDAHLALVRQSALTRLDPAATHAHVGALSRLVGQTRHYRLLAGRDIVRDPARASRLLTPLLHPHD